MAIDCDVIQADGGTRTASITGAYVALVIAVRKMIAAKTASPRSLETAVAAVNAGAVRRPAAAHLGPPKNSPL